MSLLVGATYCVRAFKLLWYRGTYAFHFDVTTCCKISTFSQPIAINPMCCCSHLSGFAFDICTTREEHDSRIKHTSNARELQMKNECM